MNAAKQKGDQAEREAAAILSDLLGLDVKRKLGAGQAEDTGDLHGLPDAVVQVAWWPNRTGGPLAAVRQKPLEAELQRENAGATYALSMIRLVGGCWRVVMTPEQFATLYREATAGVPAA